MRTLRKTTARTLGIAILSLLAMLPASAAQNGEFIVYSIYKALDFGNPNEVPRKDYYVTMGSAQGVREGTVLEVVRKLATYDLANQKLHQDISFPIAQLKIIHVEKNVAVARLAKIISEENSPIVPTRAVMVGDAVRIAE